MQHGPVADLALLHLFNGLVGLVHREEFGGGLDAVAGGYVEHLAQTAGAADGAAGNRALARDQREGMDRKRRRRHTHKAQRAGRAQSLNVGTPVLIGVGRIQDEVHGAGGFLERLRLTAVDEVVRAQRAGLFFLGRRGGKRRNLRAKNAGKLNGDVAQSTNAHHTHARRGVDAVIAQRVIDRNAAAKQRSRRFARKRIGDRQHKAHIGAHAVGVAAVAMHAGRLGLGAKILHALHAPLATAAGVRLPAESHALADFK